jgi:imidazole glycerol phosphate synthase glutamine amidotransferase subunit
VHVGILDLGINNLKSVERAFSAHMNPADSIVVVGSAEKIERPNLLILPGLGKFSAGMQALRDRNLVDKIRFWNSEGTKLVGICLGMQLLGEGSEESPGVDGLNLISSRVERLPTTPLARIPHIGWAELTDCKDSRFFPSLAAPGDLYFVHSYHLVPNEERNVLTRTPFGNLEIVSSVFSKNVLGVQFHPEKSGSKGRKLIAEITEWARYED